MSTILFRADANSSIGMGHIMRCLSIADSFRAFGHKVSFLLADDNISELVNKRGYEAKVLNSDYMDMDSELDLWPAINVDYIIIDSYYVTGNYLRTLRDRVGASGGKLVYIDDVYTFPYPVDILIDYNAYATADIYHNLYTESEVQEPQYILGSTYAPLREMFRNVSKRVQPEEVRNIFVSTGGADELHLTIAIINHLCGFAPADQNGQSNQGSQVLHRGRPDDGKTYHFLLGVLNPDKKEIKRLTAKADHIVLHENVSDMNSLIGSCDLAISSAGSTLYEIAACGVPLITFSLADNQIPGGQAFAKLGLGEYIGDLRNSDSIYHKLVMSGKLDSKAVEWIMDAIDRLSRDYEQRVIMGTRMQDLIDGFGADRIVKEINVEPSDQT